MTIDTVSSAPDGRLASPRRLLTAIAAHPQPGRTGALVAATAILSLALDATTALLGPPSLRTVGLLSAVVVAVVTVLFWLLSVWAIDLAAGAMGATRRRVALAAVTAALLPLLLSYPALSLLQTVLSNAGAGGVALALGWLAIPAVLGFIGFGIVAISSVYELGFLSAMALALLPYAMVTAAMLALSVLLSIMQATGVI